MKNINSSNVNERLNVAKNNLEVYTDLKSFFDNIASSDWVSEDYKASAAALFEAILTKIDPIDY